VPVPRLMRAPRLVQTASVKLELSLSPDPRLVLAFGPALLPLYPPVKPGRDPHAPRRRDGHPPTPATFHSPLAALPIACRMGWCLSTANRQGLVRSRRLRCGKVPQRGTPGPVPQCRSRRSAGQRLVADLRSTYATRLSAGGVADEWVTQLLRQGDVKVFKKYSRMKLQMKREALQKLNRTANERAGFWDRRDMSHWRMQ
jgi:hypothetical protein